MQRAKLLLTLLMAALLFALPPAAFAKTEGEATIKIIPQYLPYGGIEVAAWTRDDRYIITAAGTSRTVLIWDMERKDLLQKQLGWSTPGASILNRLTLPLEPVILKRRFTGIAVSKDGRSATISGEALKRDGDATFVRYRIDLESLVIEALPVPKNVARKAVWGAEQESAILALEVLFERADLDRRTGMTMEQAEKLMPELPMSHVGKRRLVRMYNYQDPVEDEGVGLKVWPAEDADPMVQLMTMQTSSRGTNRVAVSRDGTKLAFIGYTPSRNLNSAIDGVMESSISVTELASSNPVKTIFIEENFQDLHWVDDDTLALIKRDEANAGRVTSLLVSYADRKPKTIEIGSSCYQVTNGQGQIFAAGLANCSASAEGDYALKKFDNGKWTNFGNWQPMAGEKILALAVSPSGGRVALAKSGKDRLTEWIILDGQTGDILFRRAAPNQGPSASIQLPDDDILVQTGADQNGVWRFGTNDWRAAPEYARDAIAASDGQVLAVGAKGEDFISVYDPVTGQKTKSLEFGGVLKSGFVPQRPIFWAMSATDGLRFWDSKNWTTLFSIPLFYPSGMFAIDPGGRYDSTFRDDPDFLLRWLASDDPYLSLGFQTFFRDFYEPGLVGRIFSCHSQGNCAAEFRQGISVAKLNRVLPDVKITKIEQGANTHEALVTVEVREGEDAQVPNGKTRSEAYDLRLFLDGKLVTQIPQNAPDMQLPEGEEEIGDWRRRSRLADNDGDPNDGILTFQERISVPGFTLNESPSYEISAYAFNEDRMKSETVWSVFNPPTVVVDVPPPARPPRAYVISIGIDAYDENRLALDYAAADAKLFSEKLNFAQIRRYHVDPDREYPQGNDPREKAKVAPYELIRVIAAGEKNGTTRVTAKAISTILGILSGQVGKMEGQKVLAALGIDGSKLEASTPDDIVVVTFSGHGWAKKNGEFFLVPADASWPEDSPEPVTASLVSAAQLSQLFRPMKAKDIIFIIDACHSAASVDNGKFKPGPLGDPGLGQLAYDKGIRILAATQADDVALEDGIRRHGLLSFALAGEGEGLANPDGLVDIDDDGVISVNEWLGYAAWRLPRMNEDKRVRNNSDQEQGESGFRFPARAAFAKKKVQSPSLFDFRGSDEIILIAADMPSGAQTIQAQSRAD